MNADLEDRTEVRRAPVASMPGMPFEEAEVLRREEVLMLEATERSLELERL